MDDDFDWFEERRPGIWPVLVAVIIVAWAGLAVGGLVWAVTWLAGRV